MRSRANRAARPSRLAAVTIVVALTLFAVPVTAGPSTGGVESAGAGSTLYLPLLASGNTYPNRARMVETLAAGRFEDLAYGDGRLFAVLDGEIHVFDVRDPHSPRMLARWPLPQGSYQLAASGHWLYLLAPLRLTILDIGDLAHPGVVGTAPIADHGAYGGSPKMVPFGRYLLISNDCAQLTVLDVADPAHVRVVGVGGSTGGDAVVVKNLAILRHGHCTRAEQPALVAVDLRDPAAPRRIGEVSWNADTNSGAYWLLDLPATPYAAVITRGLQPTARLYEVLDDGTFVLRDERPLGAGLTGVASDERGRLYAAYPEAGAFRTDILGAADGRWTLLATAVTPPWRPAGASKGVLTTMAQSGVAVMALDARDLVRPVVGGSHELRPLSSPASAAVVGGLTYVFDAGSVLKVIDFQQPDPSRRLVTTLVSGGSGRSVQAGAYLYVGSGSGIWTAEVQDTRSPQAIGRQSASGRLLAGDPRRLLLGGEVGIWLASLSDPRRPVERYVVQGDYSDAALQADVAYLLGPCAPMGSACLRTFDVSSDLAFLSLGVGKVSIPGWRADWTVRQPIAVRGDRAYSLFRIDAQRATLVTFDVVDPTQPRAMRRESVAVTEPTDLQVLPDGRLLVSGAEVALVAADPLFGAVVTDRFAVAGPATTGNGEIYIAGGEKGLTRISLGQP